MAYANRVIYNGLIRTEIPVTNEWILTNKPNTLHITSDKVQISSDGIDTATITVQLKTPMLIDDSYENVALAGDVDILIDDEIDTVPLDSNGTGTTTVTCVEVGMFIITGHTCSCPNPITLEAI